MHLKDGLAIIITMNKCLMINQVCGRLIQLHLLVYAYILCIALRYNKPNQPRNIHFFNKTSTSILSLGFKYFELQGIYKRILNCIRILIFSGEFIHG